MAKDRFNTLDLNLLKTFLVLSQELNMRKASERLFVSQPAISQALQKLRFHFQDELFVKAPQGLTATPFTVDLAQKIAPFLDGLATVLNEKTEFAAAELSGALKIAVAPIVLTSLSGALFQHLKLVAPNATIELVGWNKETLNDIRSGEILFGISMEQKLIQSVSARALVELNSRVIVRKDHPLTHSEVTPKVLEPFAIASIHTAGWNDNKTLAADVMKEQGLTPTVGFRSEFVMAVVDVIEHTDFFMPHSDLFPLKRFPNLKALTPIVNGEQMSFTVFCYFHTKYTNSALISWLERQVRLVIEQERME
ncbi:LysR family transcriptional regulator [Vibrio sp. B1Z05]|uniref:LysR family transcriptional regulator n=1 Tax=Vibrio sp. B1Z05 TaxID=2654980 RepID=UPI00128D4431|nr:LysR family transcriptional regulator [Vibrio sp. B1Z05]MPW37231.1 LysR family transcriptional regulator [Vibrio sp. B1Z05]